MQYRTRNDQLNQLDGDQARMDIGREELRVYRKGAEEQAGDREEVGEGIRLGDRSARAEFPGMRAHAQDADRADEARVPGGAGGADGEPLAEERAGACDGTRRRTKVES